jgi:3-deoxy-7-phosphoheptulonate synthase
VTDLRTAWTPDIWRGRPALQQPAYPDAAALARAEAELAAADPVVSIDSCEQLRRLVAAVTTGGGFILQGGDCAEQLAEDPVVAADALAALVDRIVPALEQAVCGPVVRIGRIAGQFAKPRSAETETRGKSALPAYRGDGINGAGFAAPARTPDPARMIAAYRHAKASAGHLAECAPSLFTSHEALLLPYEEALARRDGNGRWWATSGHMLWAGERTRQPDGGHVAFLAGINNVVGVKCGPGFTADDLRALAATLDPGNQPGRLLLIVRHGAERIGEVLPPLLRAARLEGIAAGWMIDPMHGNTRVEAGRKRRDPAAIASEAEAFLAICAADGVRPAGIHLEMTPLAVSECGEPGIDSPFLSPCDPRLNEAQAAALIKRIAAYPAFAAEPVG